MPTEKSKAILIAMVSLATLMMVVTGHAHVVFETMARGNMTSNTASPGITSLCTKEAGNGTVSGLVYSFCLNDPTTFSRLCNSWPFMDPKPLGCASYGSTNPSNGNVASGNMSSVVPVPTPAPVPTTSGPNYIDLCNRISSALLSPCNTLVNSDNTLTPQGAHARDCIQGGALLAGAALLLGVDPGTIVSGLPIAANLGGCGDVVDFSKLSIGQLKGLGSIFR